MRGDIWYSSDHHAGHENILHLGPGRPFSSIEEHDEALIERHNAVVKPHDTAVFLGDVALRVAAMERFVPRLNGRKILVAGNHDACWTNRGSAKSVRKARQAIRRYQQAGFDIVFDSGVARGVVCGRPVLLSHLPADGDHYTEQRYAERRPDPGDLPLVCGHVHHLWREHGRQVNVGVDRWDYAPVHEGQVEAIIAAWPQAA